MHFADRMNIEKVRVSCEYEVRGETLTLSEIRIAGIDFNQFSKDVQDEALNFLTVVVRDHHKRGTDVAF